MVGIIGRNGAGKSTLLKILSQITEPTHGRVELIGRVGSLLEVGTGFHPELTGRENVYLNGAILGMSRRDIARRFDEIVAFAEIEKFLDTPVKRYSSGMYMRLAFAVAAHLEPEILIIDEVLAVGDAAFQKKCLGKMSDVAHHGRTVLFVSHNMAAIQNLCSRCLLLDQGAIVADTDPTTATAKYLENIYVAGGTPIHERLDRRGSGQARLVDIHLLNSEGQSRIDIADGRRLEHRIHVRLRIGNCPPRTAAVYHQQPRATHLANQLLEFSGRIAHRFRAGESSTAAFRN